MAASWVAALPTFTQSAVSDFLPKFAAAILCTCSSNLSMAAPSLASKSTLLAFRAAAWVVFRAFHSLRRSVFCLYNLGQLGIGAPLNGDDWVGIRVTTNRWSIADAGAGTIRSFGLVANGPYPQPMPNMGRCLE